MNRSFSIVIFENIWNGNIYRMDNEEQIDGPPSARTRKKTLSGFNQSEGSDVESITEEKSIPRDKKKGSKSLRNSKTNKQTEDQRSVLQFFQHSNSKANQVNKIPNMYNNSQTLEHGELEVKGVNAPGTLTSDHQTTKAMNLNYPNNSVSQHVPNVGATRSTSEQDTSIRDTPRGESDNTMPPTRGSKSNLASKDSYVGSVNAIPSRYNSSQMLVAANTNRSSDSVASGFQQQLSFTPALNLMNSGIFPSMASGNSIPTNEVYRILGEVNRSLGDIRRDLADLKADRKQTSEHVQGLEFDYDQLQDCLEQQGKGIAQCQDQISFVSNTAARFEHYMYDMNQRLLKLESANLKQNVLVTGLPEAEGENSLQVGKQFLKDDLRLREEEVVIKAAYRMGRGGRGRDSRPLVMQIKNSEQKSKIFKNAGKLKGSQKYVNDHLPEQLGEEARRRRQIISANKRLEKSPNKL